MAVQFENGFKGYFKSFCPVFCSTQPAVKCTGSVLHNCVRCTPPAPYTTHHHYDGFTFTSTWIDVFRVAFGMSTVSLQEADLLQCILATARGQDWRDACIWMPIVWACPSEVNSCFDNIVRKLCVWKGSRIIGLMFLNACVCLKVELFCFCF